MTLSSLITFILVLAVLIFVHELGHFVAARMFGIRVDAFKLGFGPKIISWTRGETEYGVNWIPFGGYVKIFGENPDEESTIGIDARRSFVHKPRWQQAIVLASGVAMNFIFAWILYIGVFATGVTTTPDEFPNYESSFQNPRVMISQVNPGSPAELAGIKAGDVLTEIKVSASGKDLVKGDAAFTLENITAAMDSSKGTPVNLNYLRGGVPFNLVVTPTSTIVAGKYAIGIALDNAVTIRLPFLTAVKESFFYTIQLIKMTAVGLYTFVANIFHGSPDFSGVSGPIGIAGIVGDASTLGFSYLLMITAIISINLGVVNLMPFPALDGGRILFVALEGIFRRRIPAGFANTVNAIGFGLLMILMVAVTWKDLARIFYR